MTVRRALTLPIAVLIAFTAAAHVGSSAASATGSEARFLVGGEIAVPISNSPDVRSESRSVRQQPDKAPSADTASDRSSGEFFYSHALTLSM